MISWRSYDDIKKILLTLRKTLYSIEDYLPNWIDNSQFAKYQESIIQFGTVLENMYGLKQTKVITLLEQHCEHVYHWTQMNGVEKVQQWRVIEADYINILQALSCYCEGDALACCVIVRNEAPYIKEWLEYHLIAGIKKFYVYDNESTDMLCDILDPYIEQGWVQYLEWPGDNCQLSAYNDAISKHKDEIGYIAFIDADEFLISVEDKPLPELILEIFSTEMQGEALGVNWRVYGSSHFETPPEGLVTENFVWRAGDFHERNRLIKSIVNPRKTKGFLHNPHSVTLTEGCYCISERGTVFGGAFFPDGRCDKIRINHYYTKSKEEFMQKLTRGWPDQPHLQALPEQMEYKFLKFDIDSYAVEDRIMDKYVERLRQS